MPTVILLTGTPSPNGMMDLWSQLYLIDNGERLGRTITSFRQRFFSAGGYNGYTYKLNSGSDERIQELIQDVCLTMDAADYIQLPEKILVHEYVELPSKIAKQYKTLEKEFLLLLDSDVNIEAPSAAVVGNKLLQLCNGAIYDENRIAHEVHDLKLKALKDIVEDNPTENMLVAYNFKSDLRRLQKTFPEVVVLDKEGKALIEWNKGNIKMLLAHPASAGHGLNAQYGGNVIVWFGMNWSLELYQQFNARLHRQGQTKPVRIIHLLVKNCIDEVVLKAVNAKGVFQSNFKNFFKENLK
jgi:SNF2 family DNA or RNA helicase